MSCHPDIPDLANGRLAALRRHVARLEGRASVQAHRRPISSGHGSVDAALPWGGLPRGVLHEVFAGDARSSAAAGFCTALLGRLAPKGATGGAGAAPLLWVRRDGRLHGPGLAAFGLDPARLIMARAERDREVLWAVEEGLRCPELAAVLGEVDQVSLFASRRLQLAAEATGVTALLLRGAAGGGERLPPSAAVTRWRVTPAPGPSRRIEAPRWRLELLRCRHGLPHEWIIEHRHETDHLALPALLRHGPLEPPGGPPAWDRALAG